MDKNIGASSSVARPPPSSSASNGKRQEQSSDDMRSILAAVIGLTRLGAPATSQARIPQEDSVAAPSKVTAYECRALQQQQYQMETAKKRPKMLTTTLAPSAAAGMSRPAPPPVCNNQLPLFMRHNDLRSGSATGAPSLPPSRKIKMTHQQHLPPSHFATTVVHRPTPHPHLFPEYPIPPSFTSQLRSNIHPDNLALPPKRQKVNQRSWTPPSEQPQAPHQQHQRSQQQLPPPQTATSNSITINFPETLYKILSSPSNSHIISWLPHGHGFVIRDRDLFESQILPRYFDGAKFTSFTRRLKRWKFERVRLNRWNFEQASRGLGGTYFNKYFVRGRPDLARCMMYGVEDDGEMEEEMAMKHAGCSEEKQKRGGENKHKQSGAASSFSDGVPTAMGTHRQQQHPLQLQVPKELESSYQEKNRQQQEQRWGQDVPPRQGSSSPEQLPTPYNPSDYNRSDMFNVGQAKLQRRSSKESTGNKRLQQQPPPLRKGTSSPERQQKLASQGPAPYNPVYNLCMSIARRNMTEMEMTTTRRNDSIPATSSFDRDAMLSQHHLNIISPPDSEQQQCLNDIQRRILSEMSNDNGMNYNNDKMSDILADPYIARDTPSPFMDTSQRNNYRALADQERMVQKIQVSSMTHKEIMRMASKDLQSREGLAPWIYQQQSQLEPPRMQQLPSRRRQLGPLDQHQLQGPMMPPPRTYLSSHAMMKPKEKAEKGTSAQTAAWLRGGDDVVGSSPRKRKNSWASAA